MIRRLYVAAALVTGATAAASAFAQGAPARPAASAPPAAEAAASLPQLIERAQADVDRVNALPDTAPLIGQRREVADRLLSMLTTRQALLPAAVSPAGSAPDADAAAPRLEGDGPYATLEIDRLRDRRDALAAQRDALQLSLASLDQRAELALASRRKADETVRLQRESQERVGAASLAETERARLDLADLESRAAAQELTVADGMRSATRERLAPLATRIEQLDAEIARTAASARLGDEELAAVDKRLREALSALARERRTALDRLAQATRGGDADAATAWSGTLATLAELEGAQREQGSLWQLRRSVAAARQDFTALRQLSEQVALDVERVKARQAVAEQQIGATRAARQGDGADAAAPDKSAALAREGQQHLLRAQRQLRDTLQDSLTLLGRVQAEALANAQPAGVGGWSRLLWTRLADWAREFWEFELFAASDTAQVDGRSVTVSRGVTIGKSVGVLFIVGIGYALARVTSRGIVGLLVGRAVLTERAARGTRRWIMWTLMLCVVLAALRLAHIPVTAFAFLGGALALGFGFGAQNVLKNFISGLIVLFERKIRVGDILTVGGVSGTVTDIDLRATTLRGFDGIDTVVPNSVLLEGQVNNWSLGSPSVRRSIALTVPHGTDLRQAMALLVDSATARDGVLQEPLPSVLLEDFSGPALVLRLQYWHRLDSALSGPEVDSNLRLEVSSRLAMSGIPLAVG
jgi:small-conductance mechanosensitive channel